MGSKAMNATWANTLVSTTYLQDEKQQVTQQVSLLKSYVKRKCPWAVSVREEGKEYLLSPAPDCHILLHGC